MRAMANFLFTKSQPRIVGETCLWCCALANKHQYYKPWKLLPSDEDQIKKQIAETEVTIQREVEALRKRHTKPEAVPESKKTNTSKETVGELQAEPPSVSNVSIDTTNSSIQEARSEQVMTEKNTQEEHNGEVVVEADEDTVIY